MVWLKIAAVFFLSCAYGLPQPGNVAQSVKTVETGSSNAVSDVKAEGPVNFGKVPPTHGKTLAYGPSFGITKESTLLGYYFDDTSLITRGLGSGEFRSLQIINCAHVNPGNYFIGLMEMYSSGPGDQQISTYRGWLPAISARASINWYKLKPGESWAFVTYKACGGKLVGIHFGTDKKGGGTACGDYNFNGPNPGYIPASIKCTGKVLYPPAGRKIIGLFGEANGMYFTKNQGIRGIGLITTEI